MNRELDWGRPNGRPFDPQWLTLEEWIILYRMTPATHRRYPGDAYYIPVPGSIMSTISPSADIMEPVAIQQVVFILEPYQYCSGTVKGLVWVPQGMSVEVKQLLGTAGSMNPIGESYANGPR